MGRLAIGIAAAVFVVTVSVVVGHSLKRSGKTPLGMDSDTWKLLSLSGALAVAGAIIWLLFRLGLYPT